MAQNPPESWRVLSVATADRDEWRSLLEADPAASPFHDPLFVDCFARARRGAEPGYLELRDEGGGLRGGLPFVIQRRGPFQALASGPSGAYGGPVALRPEHRARLVEAFFEHGGGRTLRREMLCRAQMEPRPPLLEGSGVGYLSVEGGFELFLRDRFPRNRRNECTRSEKRGLSCDISDDDSDIVAFQRVFADASKRWGTPPLELEFIRSLLREMAGFRLFVVRHEGDFLGGHLCVLHDDELFAWMGATLRRSGLFPAPFLFREEARHAAELGLRSVNIGASDGLPGVAGFKKLVGAEERTHWRLLREAKPLRLLRGRRKTVPE